MARTARKISNTNIYHIILRGVNHRVIFEDEQDYKYLLYCLQFYKKICNYEIFAYCIMSNHVHLLMRFSDNNLSTSMKKIEDKFIWWYNKKNHRCGHLFQDRFKSEPVENEQYLRTVFRYIHHNPINAGLITNLNNYKWSSYHEYLHQTSRLVDSAFMTNIFDGNTSLLEYINEKNCDICMENICIKKNDDEVIKIIKENTNCASLDELTNVASTELELLFQKLHQQGVSLRQISRITGFSRQSVTQFCRQESEPPA